MPRHTPTSPRRTPTHRLCIHDHFALAEQLQVPAVSHVAQPHADPELAGEGVLLSFSLWVLSQRQVSNRRGSGPPGAGAWVREGHTHLPLHPKPREQGPHSELGDGHNRGRSVECGGATGEPGSALGSVVLTAILVAVAPPVRCARCCAEHHVSRMLSAHTPLQSGRLHHRPISQRSRLGPDTAGPNSHKPVSHRTRIQVSVFLEDKRDSAGHRWDRAFHDGGKGNAEPGSL